MLVAAGETMADGRVSRLPGVTAVGTGLPILLFNQVLVDGGATPDGVAASIRAAVEIFRAQHKPYAVTLRGGIDDPYRPLLGELGLEPLDTSPWMPGMALHPLPAPGGTALPAGHEIRRVVDEAGLGHHMDMLAAGFGMPREWAEAFLTDEVSRRPEVAIYVGYQDGQPVTSGLGLRTGTTIGIYNIATVESARRRGYGAAMTMRIVDDGGAEGCEVAILQASEMGQPVYERLGFRTVVEYFGYVEPRSDGG
jgi:GNAT superfamily N-acetyltransferase